MLVIDADAAQSHGQTLAPIGYETCRPKKPRDGGDVSGLDCEKISDERSHMVGYTTS